MACAASIVEGAGFTIAEAGGTAMRLVPRRPLRPGLYDVEIAFASSRLSDVGFDFEYGADERVRLRTIPLAYLGQGRYRSVCDVPEPLQAIVVRTDALGERLFDRGLSRGAAWAARAPAPSRRAGARALAARPAGALRRLPPLSGGRRTRRCDRLPPRRRHASRRLRDLARDFRRRPRPRRAVLPRAPGRLRDAGPFAIFLALDRFDLHHRCRCKGNSRFWELHLIAGARLSPRPAPRAEMTRPSG